MLYYTVRVVLYVLFSEAARFGVISVDRQQISFRVTGQLSADRAALVIVCII